MDFTILSSQYMIANTILTMIKMTPILLCNLEPTFNKVLSFRYLLLLRIVMHKANKTSCAVGDILPNKKAIQKVSFLNSLPHHSKIFTVTVRRPQLYAFLVDGINTSILFPLMEPPLSAAIASP